MRVSIFSSNNLPETPNDHNSSDVKLLLECFPKQKPYLTNSKSDITFGTHARSQPRTPTKQRSSRLPSVTDMGDESIIWHFHIASTQPNSSTKEPSLWKSQYWCAHAICVSTFSLFPLLTAHVHLYSAELLEPLSDKAMKKTLREGWIGGGRRGPAVL